MASHKEKYISRLSKPHYSEEIQNIDSHTAANNLDKRTDDLIRTLSRAHENRRARQVSKWERLTLFRPVPQSAGSRRVI